MKNSILKNKKFISLISLMTASLGLCLFFCSCSNKEKRNEITQSVEVAERGVVFVPIDDDDDFAKKLDLVNKISDGLIMCDSGTILPYYNSKIDDTNVKIAFQFSDDDNSFTPDTKKIYAVFYEKITYNSAVIEEGKTSLADLQRIIKNPEIKTEPGFGYFIHLDTFDIFFPIDSYPTTNSVVSFIRQKPNQIYFHGDVNGIYKKDDGKLILRFRQDADEYSYKTISYSLQGFSVSENYDKDFKPNYYELCKKNQELTENNPVIKKIIWDDVEKFKAEFLRENHLDDKYFNYNCLCYNEGPDYTTAFYTIWDGDGEYTTTVLKTDKAGNIILQDVLFPDEKKSVLGAFTVTSDSYLLLIYDSYTDTTWVNIFKF